VVVIKVQSCLIRIEIMSFINRQVEKVIANTDLSDVQFTEVSIDGFKGEVLFQGLHCGLTVRVKMDLESFMDNVESL
jgi:hypothetical protein